MEAALVNLAGIILVIFFILTLILGRKILSNGRLLALFFGVFLVDNLLILVANRFQGLQVIPNHTWEGFLECGWSGKLYSILFMLALLPFVRALITREEIGWVLQQRSGAWLPSLVVVSSLAAWALLVGLNSPKGKPDAQALLYLAVMPGLNEEIVYRGYLQGALDKMIPGRLNLLGAPTGWGLLVTSLLFGLLHGFWLDASLAVHIEWIALRNATISGFIFAWLKMRTGSLVLPVMAHGLEDFLFFLPRMW